MPRDMSYLAMSAGLEKVGSIRKTPRSIFSSLEGRNVREVGDLLYYLGANGGAE